MAFHKHVLEVIDELKLKKDKRLKTMLDLANKEDAKDLEKMWKSLYEAEKKLNGAKNNEWVSMFLQTVASAKEAKPYFLMNGETRKKHLEKIRVCTKELSSAYKKLGLDHSFILYDPEYLGLLDEDGQPIIDKNLLPIVSITEALNFCYEIAKEDLKNFTYSGKINDRHMSNRFIRILGQRNLARYKTPLYGVLIKAAAAVYGKEYSEADAHHLVKGRKNGKNHTLQSPLK